MGTKCPGCKGALPDQSAAKGLLEELMAVDELKALLAADQNGGRKLALELSIREMKATTGLALEIDKRFAREVWKDPSLHMGAGSGVQEAQDFLARIRWPRSILLPTKLRVIRHEEEEEVEALDRDDTLSAKV